MFEEESVVSGRYDLILLVARTVVNIICIHECIIIMVMMMAFPSLAMTLGECSIIHFLPALFFFKVEITSCTLIPLFMPESVHGGSAGCDDRGRMFSDKLCVSLFPDRFPHYA